MSDGAVVTIQWDGPLGKTDIRYNVGDRIFESEKTTGMIIAVEVSTGRDKRAVVPVNSTEKDDS